MGLKQSSYVYMDNAIYDNNFRLYYDLKDFEEDVIELSCSYMGYPIIKTSLGKYYHVSYYLIEVSNPSTYKSPRKSFSELSAELALIREKYLILGTATSNSAAPIYRAIDGNFLHFPAAKISKYLENKVLLS